MTKSQIQDILMSARQHLVEGRANRGEYNANQAHNEAWSILFAAENLIADPEHAHSRAILRA
jgi:hypothetical protein